MLRKQTQRGFSLIEMLVVIIIIGIIATGAIIVFTNHQKKARDAMRLSHIEELRNVMERFKAESDDSVAVNDNDPVTLSDALVPRYLQSMPEDPGNRSYQYDRNAILSSDFFFGAYDGLKSTVPDPKFFKTGPSPDDVEFEGVDGDPATDPINGIEFGY